MGRPLQNTDFCSKLAIMFEETDLLSCDADKESRYARPDDLNPMVIDRTSAKQRGSEAEPGCLSFSSRKLRAESNPYLKDFFRWFHEKHKSGK
jgi:hypothetical protein